MNKLYSEKFYDKMVLILILVVFFSCVYSKIYSKNMYVRLLYILFGIVGLTKVCDRDFFLPFLGDSVFPQGLLKQQTVYNHDVTVQLKNLPPNVKIVYWASMPKKTQNLLMPWKAYEKYENSGVTYSDVNGSASLHIMDPQAYKTPFGKILKPHVHYRYFLNNGMMSRIYTQFI